MRSYEDLKVDMKRLAPRIQYLVQIVRILLMALLKKRSRNVLDFSDYEHFALQILTDQRAMLRLLLKNIDHNLKRF